MSTTAPLRKRNRRFIGTLYDDSVEQWTAHPQIPLRQIDQLHEELDRKFAQGIPYRSYAWDLDTAELELIAERWPEADGTYGH